MDETRADVLLGYAAASVGASGAALQWWGQLGDLLLVGLHLLLTIAGLWLVGLRIRKARLELALVKSKREERA